MMFGKAEHSFEAAENGSVKRVGVAEGEDSELEELEEESETEEVRITELKTSKGGRVLKQTRWFTNEAWEEQ